MAAATAPKMTTVHTHWLRGNIFNTRVAVRLNGILLGKFWGHIDKDISMKLHTGVNTVTFITQPNSSDASAHLVLLESEHDPPIAPLVHFDLAKSKEGMSETETTQTFTFLAQ